MKDDQERKDYNKDIDKIFDFLDPRSLEKTRFDFDIAMKIHDLLDSVEMNSFDLAKSLNKPQNLVDRQLMAMYHFEIDDILDIMVVINEKRLHKRNKPEKDKTHLQKVVDYITPKEQARTDLNMVMAAQIAQGMEDAGVEKKELAKRLEINEEKLEEMMSGTHDFSVDDIVDLRMALEIPLCPI